MLHYLEQPLRRASATAAADTSRRAFLKASGGIGVGLVIGFALPGLAGPARAATGDGGTLTPFVRIAPDGMITVEPCYPHAPEATALLQASHALQQSLYPPEHIFALSIDDLCAPHIAFFIARDGDRALGCAALAAMTGYGEIKSMFVDPSARGSGTGSALMERLESHARSLGLPMLRLETGDDLYAAQRLYQRHGFGLCGPYGDYVEGPHSVFMEKPLS